MNPDTAAIAHFENEEDARRAGHARKLSPEELQAALPMNRAARRQWAREQARKEKKARKAQA